MFTLSPLAVHGPVNYLYATLSRAVFFASLLLFCSESLGILRHETSKLEKSRKWGSGDRRRPPVGSRGNALVGGQGGEAPLKLKHFALFRPQK